MFKQNINNKEQCAPIDSENAFLSIISSLLTAQDIQSKNKTITDRASKKNFEITTKNNSKKVNIKINK